MPVSRYSARGNTLIMPEHGGKDGLEAVLESPAVISQAFPVGGLKSSPNSKYFIMVIKSLLY